MCQVLEAVAVLLGLADVKWAQLRRILDGSLLSRLASLDLSRVVWAQAERLRVLLQLPTFTDGTLVERCPAAAHLAAWCVAIGKRLEENPPPQPPPPSPGPSSSARGLGRPDQLQYRRAASPAAVQPTAGHTDPVTPGNVQGSARTKPKELGDLNVVPELWLLSESELARVPELCVSRAGVGSVTFHGETDCRKLAGRLAKLVVLERGEVIVYPDQATKPPAGEGLNKPASILLLGCVPKVHGFRDTKARDRYTKRVKQMTEEKGAEFVDYDCDEGVWRFRVRHF